MAAPLKTQYETERCSPESRPVSHRSFKKKASLNFRGIRIRIPRHEDRPLFSVTTCRGKTARIPAGTPGDGPALAFFWVAPLFRDTAVVTEHRKDARRSPRKPSLAWRHLEAHAAQPASRANPNHYSHERHRRLTDFS